MTKTEERVIRVAMKWVATDEDFGTTSIQLHVADKELRRAVKALLRERKR